MITEDAFARDGRYSGDTNQAASVSNKCLNPIFDSNTIDNAVSVGNCAGTVSQQDESGSASAPITSQAANPDIELQRATTTQPDLGAPLTCEECWADLLPDQVSQFLSAYPAIASDPNKQYNTIGDLCEDIALKIQQLSPGLAG